MPFPWLHHHAAYAATAGDGSLLPVHLDQFHAGQDASEQGWHLHYVYLGAEESNDPLKQKLPPQHFLILGEANSSPTAGSVVGLSPTEQFLADLTFCQSSSHVIDVNSGFRAQRHGPPGSASCLARSLRDLTSVSRC
ncbi:hypothetical protein [Gimesia panareensis]|uniref:hypothetical protein n=1 Tax=Gimesia panareensis TaxID=2527978 RepID=UPI0011A9F968|nr:hypothetical protein [Gimesia panareensis]